MTDVAIRRKETQRLVDIAATWGRVGEREGYGDFGLPTSKECSFSTGPGLIDKSGLFQRLLSGKEPLAYKPPTSHSYPW